MPYEQSTWHVEVEEDEDDRKKIVIYRKYELIARSDCSLCGRAFRKGDLIEIITPREIDLFYREPQGGPWGTVGQPSKWIQENAIQITDLRDNSILHRQTR